MINRYTCAVAQAPSHESTAQNEEDRYNNVKENIQKNLTAGTFPEGIDDAAKLQRQQKKKRRRETEEAGREKKQAFE